MGAKTLLLVGVAWFLAATAFEIYLGRTDFAIGWLAKGPVSTASSVAGIYLLIISAVILLIGWTIPVGIGLYRLVRR